MALIKDDLVDLIADIMFDDAGINKEDLADDVEDQDEIVEEIKEKMKATANNIAGTSIEYLKENAEIELSKTVKVI